MKKGDPRAGLGGYYGTMPLDALVLYGYVRPRVRSFGGTRAGLELEGGAIATPESSRPALVPPRCLLSVYYPGTWASTMILERSSRIMVVLPAPRAGTYEHNWGTAENTVSVWTCSAFLIY